MRVTNKYLYYVCSSMLFEETSSLVIRIKLCPTTRTMHVKFKFLLSLGLLQI